MRSTFAILALVTATAAAAEVEIEVHLYNSANLSQSLIEKAISTTDQVFAGTAMTLRWQMCDAACIDAPGAPVFVIGIAGPQLKIPVRGALGFAMIAIGKGNRAVVSAPRIEDFAESTATSTGVALGHAIAHELGHLIAQTRNHSCGVMTATWGNAIAARMRQGSLRFGIADIEAMHKNLKARNQPVRLASVSQPEL
jgi:hypothetical protein